MRFTTDLGSPSLNCSGLKGIANLVSMEVQVHIVGDPSRGTLLEILPEWRKFCTIKFISGVYLSKLEDLAPGVADIERFSVRSGKRVLLSEVGAALAHVDSCKALLASSQEWALVLEDDAEINDLAELISRVGQCIEAFKGNFPTVISFYSRNVRESGKGEELINGVNFIPISIGFTVAYLINRSAAQKIIEAQLPVTSTADWPVGPPTINFAIDKAGLVDHLPPELRQSTISPSGEKRSGSRWTRIQIWSGIWFLRNREFYDGFDDYLTRSFNKRLYYHAYVVPRESQLQLTASSLIVWLSQRLWISLRGAPENTRMRVD